MPRSGDQYALPPNTLAVTEEVISSTKFNTLAQDIESEQNAVRPVVHGGTGVGNLTDLRTNMGALAAADLVGAIVQFGGDTPPDGWLECDGSAISRTTYADLYAAIGTGWGSGDGSTTFNVPDFRGEFVRGWDHGRGIDSERALGSAQADATGSHTHAVGTLSGNAQSAGSHSHSIDPPNTSTTSVGNHQHGSGSLGGSTNTTGNHNHSISNFLQDDSDAGGGSTTWKQLSGSVTTSTDGAHSHSLNISGSTAADGAHSHTVNISPFNSAAAGGHTHTVSLTGATASTGGSETRPRNLAAMFIIRY